MTTELQPNFNFFQSANEQGERIAENFIVRKVEFETVIEDIRSNPMEGSIQHFLFLGRRGSGKSTLLKRIEYEIETDRKLSKYLIPINLAEEQANIYRLYDLWEEIIKELRSRGIVIDTSNLNEDNTYEYNRQLYQLIHDALIEHKKKIVLLLDNIDRVFENVGDDAAQLREVLLNYKDLKIIGGSTRMSEHFWSYAKPFYNFFRVIKLGGLNSQEIKTLLLHWSEIYNLPQLKDFVENKPGQIETIRIMTDGLPRTLKFFISLIVNRSQKDSYGYLRQILDYLTPLYQERLNSLPSAHRKIVLQLAFIWESTEVKTLAEACKMQSGLVSAHLKQLTTNGIVSKIETGKRNHFYKIEERFFNLWLIFTQGSPSDKRKQKCLTIFLENWYDKKEIKDLAIEHLRMLEKEGISANDVALFSKALVHSKYITVQERDEIIEKTLQLKGLDDYFRKELPHKVLNEIHELIKKEDWDNGIEIIKNIEQEDGIKEVFLGYLYQRKGNQIKAETYYLDAINKGEKFANFNLGALYHIQNKFELAEKYYLQSKGINDSDLFHRLGILYESLHNVKLAEENYLKALKGGNTAAMINVGIMYGKQEKYKLAEKYLLLAKGGKDIDAFYNLGLLYEKQQKLELAEKYYTNGTKKNDIDALFNLAYLYYRNNMKRDKALDLITKHNKNNETLKSSVLQVILSVWNGAFIGIKEKTLSILSEASIELKQFLIMNLLIHHQKSMVLSLFEDEKLKEQHIPLYYATLLLENEGKDENLLLKIPSELLTTVQDIVASIKEKQDFYYPSK